MKEEDIIELRSEKVQNIIGQIPPITIRIGLAIILLITTGLFCMVYFINYDYIIKTTGTIEQRDTLTMIEIKVPATLYYKIERGNKVIISFDDIPYLYDEKLETKVQKLSNNLLVTNTGGYVILEIGLPQKIRTISKKNILIFDCIKIKVEIITKKVSLFDRIVGSEF